MRLHPDETNKGCIVIHKTYTHGGSPVNGNVRYGSRGTYRDTIAQRTPILFDNWYFTGQHIRTISWCLLILSISCLFILRDSFNFHGMFQITLVFIVICLLVWL